MITIDMIETSSLGDRSYLVADDQVAVVIDPQRDIDRILTQAQNRGVRVTHVLETHVHNDYVTGGFELAGVTGADYILPAGSEVIFAHVPAGDGDVLTAGTMRIRALHTPGHTHHHTSYVLEDATGAVLAVFTGGSMLHGATGRTDLVGPEHTDALTHAQFHSVRRLAAELPAQTQVFPTHGFGSFCSATPTSGNSSTVGEQGLVNPALTLAEQDYVDTLLAGLDAYPAYYVQMAKINRTGPAPLDLATPVDQVDPVELRARIERGEWVVDLRERTAFAAGHLPGTRAFELSGSFVSYLGWLIDWGAPLTLIGASRDQVAEARRELVRIGIDRLAGAAVGDIASLTTGPLRSYQVSDFAGLAAARGQRNVTVLDARRQDEHAQAHVSDSLHIPIHELRQRMDEVPDGEVWVYCGSGYRAAIAASLLDQPGREVVLVNDAYPNAAEAGLEQRTTAGAQSA